MKNRDAPAGRLYTLLCGQGVLDGFLKSGEGLCAGEEATVDEECRRTAHSGAVPFINIFRDSLGVFVAVQAGVELCRIQLQVRCELLQIGRSEGSIVRKHEVMVLPVLSLFRRTARSFSRLLGVLMNGQGKIFVHNLHLVFVRLTNFGEFRLNSSAVWSLKVGEFNECYRRIGLAPHRGAVDGDVDHWRFEQHLHCGCLA